MDEEAFRRFLEKNHLRATTIRNYVQYVKNFEDYLLGFQKRKQLGDAKGGDIKAWKLWAEDNLEKIRPYLYGIRWYYRFVPKNKIVNVIDEILSTLPKRPIQPRTITLRQFRGAMSEFKESGINARDSALLNLLWSEVHPSEILELYISDIDFDQERITSHISGTTFYATKEAWDALHEYVPIEDRGVSRPLFPGKRRFLSPRSSQYITERYFKTVGWHITPTNLFQSCRVDIEKGPGRRARFVGLEPDEKLVSSAKTEQKERLTTESNLINRLVQEIRNFGSKFHERIGRIKDEEELKRLLEGYLAAALPSETVIPEYAFKGHETTPSKIDFVVGKKHRIPIEVKLAKKRIRQHLRGGLGQVKEFLRYSESKNGVLVIGDKERDPKRQRHNGLEDNVHIIVI